MRIAVFVVSKKVGYHINILYKIWAKNKKLEISRKHANVNLFLDGVNISANWLVDFKNFFDDQINNILTPKFIFFFPCVMIGFLKLHKNPFNYP